ncbi:hypothetical protein AAY473_028148 [Plecturocebus cupreus]
MGPARPVRPHTPHREAPRWSTGKTAVPAKRVVLATRVAPLPGTSRHHLTLSPKLECSGANMAHCSLDLLGSSNPLTSASHVETVSHFVAQASLKLLGSSNPSAFVSQNAGITGMSQGAWLLYHFVLRHIQGFTMLVRLVLNSQPHVICLPWPPKCLDYRREPSHPAKSNILNLLLGNHRVKPNGKAPKHFTVPTSPSSVRANEQPGNGQNVHLGRLRWVNHLRSGVLAQPDQRGETSSLPQIQKLARRGGTRLQSQLLGRLRQENCMNLGGRGRSWHPMVLELSIPDEVVER